MKSVMKYLNSAFKCSLVLGVLCCVVYPAALTLAGQALFPKQANGSLITVTVDGQEQVVGSEYVGQQFEDSRFFHGRISSVNYNCYTEEEKAEGLWQVEGWERASVSGNEKQKKSSADSQKRKTNKIWKPVAGFGAALVLLLGITAGMAGGYIPRISKEIFLLGILAAMILGMLSYILIKKVCGKKKKPDTIKK